MTAAAGPQDVPGADASSEKAALRRHYRALRRSQPPVIAQGLQQVARQALPQLLGDRGRLGLYWPLAGEPDLAPFAPGGLAERQGGGLALPVALPSPEGSGPGSLIYRPWERAMVLQPDSCGIPAPPGPEALAPEDLALLLVPALAIDGQGVRLGSGGGWYDRLRAQPRWRAVPALAVLPAACRSPRLPREPWDVPFDGWLDETGLHWIAGAPVAGGAGVRA